MAHIDMLKMNGFELVVDDEAEVGHRVKLLALPVSHGTSFSVDGQLPSLFVFSR